MIPRFCRAEARPTVYLHGNESGVRTPYSVVRTCCWLAIHCAWIFHSCLAFLKEPLARIATKKSSAHVSVRTSLSHSGFSILSVQAACRSSWMRTRSTSSSL